MADFSFDGLRSLLRAKIGPERHSDMIDRSFRLAYDGHHAQFRDQADKKATRIPYITHPVGVALLATELLPLVDLFDTFDDVISAALTHDLLEDTKLSLSDIEAATSKRVARIVSALTKPPTKVDVSRTQRNALFVQQIVDFGPNAMFVKVC